ncbi:hypothetical protein B0T20DRAFT_484273 [Sordaria brevicollis]|uniref:Bulb-type lectin domain-containing protein n=1 Tax=Sordaria brevicollis TaxID=83679 RepID=A0AAE0U2R7_SORBR|nr:hypothetical protein B0T20DRAFT_484273 [Sordaria brevicollis]
MKTFFQALALPLAFNFLSVVHALPGGPWKPWRTGPDTNITDDVTIIPRQTSCISTGDQSTINALFSSGGANTVVRLCPGVTIPITAPIVFTASGQEISTQGYPTDSTRATILIQPGSTVTSAIRGNWQNNVKILNIQVDGNRPNAGYLGGDALLEMGGGTTGQTVSHTVVKNTRSWSCVHFIGSGQDNNPCRQATVTFNDVGPCGHEGTDPATGNGLWADGLSIECMDTSVTDNTITGATDGGIVIFGSPGTHVLRNTIVSTSSSGLQFGGINMVDPTWGANYTGVVVSSNTITGGPNSFINLGIGMGSQVWSNPHPETNFGQVTVTNNVFTGNIGFSIVINGWLGGLTVTGNSVSGVTTPSSSFASAAGCGSVQQASFAASQQLVYYPAGVTGSSGPNTIQPQFTALSTNASNWLCLTNPLPPLPDTKSFAPNTLSVDASVSRVVSLRDFHVQVQGDGNVVGIDTTGGVWTVKWASSRYSTNCGTDGSQCFLAFGIDGNLVMYDATGPLWASNTDGRGVEVIFSREAPWVSVMGAGGRVCGRLGICGVERLSRWKG